ncbi:MAG: hypothetical protein K8R89_07500 [Anaerolineae bacterium]|nr:hypothetical protein [Anaerolineae bacterium]
MGLIIRLNGSNYVSEKTKAAFEETLNDGYQIKGGGGQERECVDEGAVVRDQLPAVRSQPHIPQPPAYTAPQCVQALDGLEHGLERSHEHQQLMLQTHSQYMQLQSNYADTFSALMQQQGDIFAQSNTTPQQAEVARKVLETLAESMARFHDLQVETLGVHKQYLAQQTEYSQAHFQLLREQHQRILSGNGALGPESERAIERESDRARRQESERASKLESEKAIERESERARRRESEAALERASEKARKSEAVVAQQLVSSAGPVALPAAEVLIAALLAVVSEKTGYPAEMLELEMDMEADLGIDSIKRVEILSALAEQYPELPVVEPDSLTELHTLGQIVEQWQEKARERGSEEARGRESEKARGRESEKARGRESEEVATQQPVSSAASVAPPAAGALAAALLAVVSEKTGYPAEMLELEMDLEADLGIDSIKRVEILSALAEQYPELPAVEPDSLTELHTLGQIVEQWQAGMETSGAPETQPSASGTEKKV